MLPLTGGIPCLDKACNYLFNFFKQADIGLSPGWSYFEVLNKKPSKLEL